MSSGFSYSRTALVLCGLLAATAAMAQSDPYPELSVSTGASISEGDYGTDAEVRDTYVPLGFTAVYEKFAFSISVPYLSVDTTSEGVTTTTNGLGDITASLTAFNILYSGDLDMALDVTGSYKFGSADRDKGLGTGENDATIYLDGYKFFDSMTLFGSVGHRWRGEPPDVSFDDVFLATAGLSYATEGGQYIGVMADYRQSSIPEFDDIQEVQAYFVLPLGDALELEIYAFTGFTDSSPAWGAGFAIAADLRRLAYRRMR
jgi:hypothetical protein